MTRRWAIVAAVLGALAIGAPSAGFAQDASEVESPDPEARQAFRDGRAAYDEGRYEAALVFFTRSYELARYPELLYNIGLAHDRLRHDRDALAAFRAYLDAVPTTPNRPAIESRIRVLEEEVAREDEVARRLEASSSATATQGEDIAASPILWTLIAVAVVAIGVGVGVGVALSQDPGTSPPSAGPSGVLVFALE